MCSGVNGTTSTVIGGSAGVEQKRIGHLEINLTYTVEARKSQFLPRSDSEDANATNPR